MFSEEFDGQFIFFFLNMCHLGIYTINSFPFSLFCGMTRSIGNNKKARLRGFWSFSSGLILRNISNFASINEDRTLGSITSTAQPMDLSDFMDSNSSSRFDSFKVFESATKILHGMFKKACLSQPNYIMRCRHKYKSWLTHNKKYLKLEE